MPQIQHAIVIIAMFFGGAAAINFCIVVERHRQPGRFTRPAILFATSGILLALACLVY